MSFLRLSLGAAICLLTMVMVGFFALMTEHVSTAEREISYYLNLDYKSVRKALAKTDALEYIITKQQGELVSRHWNNLTFSADRLVPMKNWEVNGLGEFIVKAKDERGRSLLLNFRQKIYASEDRIESRTMLIEPAGSVREVQTYFTITPAGEQSQVNTKISVVYRRKVPKFLINFMDRKVGEITEQMLAKNKAAIKELVETQPSKRINFQLDGNRQGRRAKVLGRSTQGAK